MNRESRPTCAARSIRAFTLIEIIVAVAIMTILLGAALPVISIQMDRGRRDETCVELNTLKTAIEGYFFDIRAFPADLDELWFNNAGVSGWVGPYLNPPISSTDSTLPDISKDAWNQDYLLTYTGGSHLEIRSPGKDGAPASSDDLWIHVDVTFLRRSETLAELALINQAITAYNKSYLAVDPLPTSWTSLVAKLQSTGFLPAGWTELLTDGWGQDYEPDPSGRSPVVRVTSPNL